MCVAQLRRQFRHYFELVIFGVLVLRLLDSFIDFFINVVGVGDVAKVLSYLREGLRKRYCVAGYHSINTVTPLCAFYHFLEVTWAVIFCVFFPTVSSGIELYVRIVARPNVHDGKPVPGVLSSSNLLRNQAIGILSLYVV